MNYKSLFPYAFSALVLSGTTAVILASATGSLPINVLAPAFAASSQEQTRQASLVVYSDFQCPACKRFAPRLNELEQKYGEHIKIEFRNFPLPQHKNAVAAASAAEAARNQGRFAAMHDLLFANQEAWSGQSDPAAMFAGYAQQIGLDVNRFNSDFNSSQIAEKIAADMQSAAKDGLQQTPTVFVNRKPVTGKQLAQLEQLIDASIKPTVRS